MLAIFPCAAYQSGGSRDPISYPPTHLFIQPTLHGRPRGAVLYLRGTSGNFCPSFLVRPILPLYMVPYELCIKVHEKYTRHPK